MTEVWGSDVPVSQPAPADDLVLVDFGGFGFSPAGMRHNLGEAEREEMFTPLFAPEGHRE